MLLDRYSIPLSNSATFISNAEASFWSVLKQASFRPSSRSVT